VPLSQVPDQLSVEDKKLANAGREKTKEDSAVTEVALQ
jgi:hypothetical protein